MAPCLRLDRLDCTGTSSMWCGSSFFPSFTSGLCSDDDAAISQFGVVRESRVAGLKRRCACRLPVGIRRESPNALSAGGARRVSLDVDVPPERTGSGLSLRRSYAPTHFIVADCACAALDESAALGFTWIALVANREPARRMDCRCRRNVVMACTTALQCRCLITARQRAADFLSACAGCDLLATNSRAARRAADVAGRRGALSFQRVRRLQHSRYSHHVCSGERVSDLRHAAD